MLIALPCLYFWLLVSQNIANGLTGLSLEKSENIGLNRYCSFQFFPKIIYSLPVDNSSKECIEIVQQICVEAAVSR
jgi:hypothetical protein